MMKYLIVKQTNGKETYGMEMAFVFPATVEHRRFSELTLEPLGLKAIRGGFVHGIGGEGDAIKIRCHGQSVSLNLNSDPETDKALILESLDI